MNMFSRHPYLAVALHGFDSVLGNLSKWTVRQWATLRAMWGIHCVITGVLLNVAVASDR